jgi:hypothetical protein
MLHRRLRPGQHSRSVEELHRQEYIGGAGFEARALVVNGWSSAQTYAADAFTAANNYLAALQAAAADLAAIDGVNTNLVDIGTITTALTAFTTAMPVNTPVLTFTDQDYSSAEFTHLKAQVDLWVQGASTGLAPAVEQAIWDRGRSREVMATMKKAQSAYRQFAARGFTKPPGALSIELQDAAQEAQNTDVTLSRDVMIKQADLEQSNRRFAFEIAEKIQAVLIEYLKDKMRRAMEIAKTLTEMQVQSFGHTMQGYVAQATYAGHRNHAEAELQRAQADIQIAEGNIRVEATKADIQSLIQKANMTIEAIRAAAQISGQLAASALSAVNLSGALHDSSSWGVSISDARSRSVSASESAQAVKQETEQL